jgi:hypothetical protein
MSESAPIGPEKFSQMEKMISLSIAWAEGQSARILENGELLRPEELELAEAAGVAHPEKVRILEVESLPLPDDEELKQAALSAGMLGPNMVGLTLGHGIFIVRGHRSTRLVSHELRHVFQYEEAGSIANFMPKYLEQLVSCGYANAPLEIDARKHEQR